MDEIENTLYREIKQAADESGLEAKVEFYPTNTGGRFAVTSQATIGGDDKWISNVGLVTVYVHENANWSVEWNRPHHPLDIAFSATVLGRRAREIPNQVVGTLADPDSIEKLLCALSRALGDWQHHMLSSTTWQKQTERRESDQ